MPEPGLFAALAPDSTAPPDVVAKALAAMQEYQDHALRAEAEASVALDKGECGTRAEPVFESFQKISRWSRDIIITEKIDGTNGVVWIGEDGLVMAGSRNRWLYPPQSDNFGFAKWIAEHEAELREGLGPGRHFGEWWGQGIQRGYDLREKRFSLFNVHRWHDPQAVSEGKSLRLSEKSNLVPSFLSVVPVIYYGQNRLDQGTAWSLAHLMEFGSSAAPGFMRPEGIVIYHTASKTLFKKTIKDDEKGKEQ